MTPEDLAQKHPLLYHVTTPGSWKNISQKGLLSTSKILDLFAFSGTARKEIEQKRRDTEIHLENKEQGQIIINDNTPLTEKALLQCLEDDLTPADWMMILNSRVFFWPDKKNLDSLLSARLNKNRAREVIVVDTLSLAKTHAQSMELCPINSGATIRKPAKRGLQTFTPLGQYSFQEWRKLRNGRDNIREVTVKDAVLDIARYVVEVYVVDR